MAILLSPRQVTSVTGSQVATLPSPTPPPPPHYSRQVISATDQLVLRWLSCSPLPSPTPPPSLAPNKTCQGLNSWYSAGTSLSTRQVISGTKQLAIALSIRQVTSGSKQLAIPLSTRQVMSRTSQVALLCPQGNSCQLFNHWYSDGYPARRLAIWVQCCDR